MSLDPVRVADTKEWFKEAQEDIRAAEILCCATPPLYDHSANLCQQAVEKTLKGFLFWHTNKRPQKTHDLNVLGDKCVAIDSSLTSLIGQATPLTQYAVESKYPGIIEHPSLAEVEGMIDIVKTLFAKILSLMPSVINP